jgi:hypothetical protein
MPFAARRKQETCPARQFVPCSIASIVALIPSSPNMSASAADMSAAAMPAAGMTRRAATRVKKTAARDRQVLQQAL